MTKKPIFYTESEQRAKIAQWILLRESLSAVEAMRKMEIPEERMRKWAVKLGIEVPPVDRAVALAGKLGIAPVVRSDADWRTVIGEWIAARLNGVASVPAAKGLGMMVSTLEHHARRLGVVIPAEAKGIKGPNAWEVERDRKREETFKKFLRLLREGGSVSKAAQAVGRSVQWVRESARKFGVDLTVVRKAGRRAASSGSVTE